MSSSSVKESSYAMDPDKTELVTGMLVRAAWLEIGRPSLNALGHTAAYTMSTYASSSVQESSYAAMDKTDALVTGMLINTKLVYPCMARPLQPLDTPP